MSDKIVKTFGDVLALGLLAKVTSDISENVLKPKRRKSSKRNTGGFW